MAKLALKRRIGRYKCRAKYVKYCSECFVEDYQLGLISTRELNYLSKHKGEQVQVYDLLVPLVLNGESVGALNIGYSIDAIENSVNKMRIAIAITALIVLLIIAAVLYFVTNDK